MTERAVRCSDCGFPVDQHHISCSRLRGKSVKDPYVEALAKIVDPDSFPFEVIPRWDWKQVQRQDRARETARRILAYFLDQEARAPVEPAQDGPSRWFWVESPRRLGQQSGPGTDTAGIRT